MVIPDEKTIKYPVRTIRLSDEVWEHLREEYKRSDKSWNLFIKEILAK